MLTAVNPTTGKILREVVPDDNNAVDKCLAIGAKAYESWRKTSFSERSAIMYQVAAYLREHKARLANLMTEEIGKPVNEGYGEIEKSAWCVEHYAEHAETYLAIEEITSDASKSYVQYLPIGPVLGILPWNAPFWLAFRFLAPALMAGNTCVIKHDDHVPGCAKALGDLFLEIGAPVGIVQLLFIERPEVQDVIRDTRIQAVSFTGSSQGGAVVAQMAASEIKPAVLELGGSDPAIVLADADLDLATETITLMRIINAGQSCIAAKRIIVEKPVYETMIGLLKTKLEVLKVGDPALKETQIGPIARRDLRDNLHRQVQSTIDKGAKCLLGGTMPDGPGFFYPVTLLVDVNSEMCAFKEETFGPVAVVVCAKDAEEALHLANDTMYGLGASVWTSTERGEAMARELAAGQVSVNGIVKTDPRLPSGGVKRSGYGRELGPQGIKEFVNTQQVWVGPPLS